MNLALLDYYYAGEYHSLRQGISPNGGNLGCAPSQKLYGSVAANIFSFRS